MYCKFINKNYVYPCPINGYINNRGISNLNRYFQKNPDIAKAEGYKELILVDRPEYDETTQYLTCEYIDTDETIIQNWIINEAPEEEIDIENRIAELKA
jgi:hypothetical protein